MYDLIIQNCRVLSFNSENKPEIWPNQDIIVDDGKIVMVQATDPADSARAHELIDAEEKLALPGLINTHAHVPMVIFRGLAEDVLHRKMVQ